MAPDDKKMATKSPNNSDQIIYRNKNKPQRKRRKKLKNTGSGPAPLPCRRKDSPIEAVAHVL